MQKYYLPCDFINDGTYIAGIISAGRLTKSMNIR